MSMCGCELWLGYSATPIIMTCVFHGGRVNAEFKDSLHQSLLFTSVVEPVLVFGRDFKEVIEFHRTNSDSLSFGQ